MAATGHGATFRFTSDRGTLAGGVTNVKVDSPVAEVTDMTSVSHDASMIVLVPTGSWKGGTITTDFVVNERATPAQMLVRGVGSLVFWSPAFTFTFQVILESAETTVAAGDVIRGTAKFIVTDYYA